MVITMSKDKLTLLEIHEQELQKGFVGIIVDQPKLLDDLGKQIIAISLVVPGIYATVLKLVEGSDSVLKVTITVYIAFFCWFSSLVLALFSVMPKKWNVNVESYIQGMQTDHDEVLTINDFFFASAKYKRRLLIIASLFCFIGFMMAGISVF